MSDPGASKVDAVIWWRRRDAHPERKAVLVTDDKANPVALVAPPLVSAPCGVVSFVPNGAALYHVYYLPYYQSGTGAQLRFHWYNCTDQHDRSCAMASLPLPAQPQPQPPASSPAACTAPTAAGTARATVVAIEGRQVSSSSGPADFHALTSMELVATPEVRRASHPRPPPHLRSPPTLALAPAATFAVSLAYTPALAPTPHPHDSRRLTLALQPSPHPATPTLDRSTPRCSPRQQRATPARRASSSSRVPARCECSIGCRRRGRGTASGRGSRSMRARESSLPFRWRVRGVCVGEYFASSTLPPTLPPPLPLPLPPPLLSRWGCSAWPT